MKAIFLADSKRKLPCECESALLLPIVNRPVVWHQMNMLKDWGVTEVVFADQGLKPSLQGILAGGDRWGVEVSYASAAKTFDDAKRWIVLAPGWV
jgi:dTDP-glucose pyrophosphorylase